MRGRWDHSSSGRHFRRQEMGWGVEEAGDLLDPVYTIGHGAEQAEGKKSRGGCGRDGEGETKGLSDREVVLS